jgi:hypothetical protein
MKFRKLRIAWLVFWGLACVLVIMLWVRSHARHDVVFGQLTSGLCFYLESSPSQLEVFVGHSTFRWAVQSQRYYGTSTETKYPIWTGFTFRHRPLRYTFVDIPYWSLAGFMAVLALAAAPRRFSLRTLLIAMTLFALLFGLVVYAIR